jgi:hypothetical protein
MSELKVSGKIVHISEIQTGQGKSGEWKKLNFVIETDGQYPKKVSFDYFGAEKVDNFIQYRKPGDTVEVSFNVESREYEGKWYTNINAWKVWHEKEGITTQEQENAPIGEGMEPDQLPF